MLCRTNLFIVKRFVRNKSKIRFENPLSFSFIQSLFSYLNVIKLRGVIFKKLHFNKLILEKIFLKIVSDYPQLHCILSWSRGRT